MMPTDSSLPPVSDREAWMQRFGAWLDEVLEPEPPPRGIAAEILDALEAGDALPDAPSTDLHALWSATTALTQEIKLQGRSFKQLADVMEPLPALAPRVEEMLVAHDEAMEATHDVAHEVRALAGARAEQERRLAESRADGKLVDVLLDVRDRLVRGLHSAHDARTRIAGQARAAGWAARLAKRFAEPQGESATSTVTSLEEGYRLGLARLDAALEELQVSEIPSEGRSFDPRSMNAIEVEATDAVPRGTVLEVFRAGYTWQGEVHRVAQVKVARPVAAGG